MPVTFAAWAAGDSHAEHALVLLRVLPHVADDELRAVVEAALVDLCREQAPFLVARKADELLAALGADEDGKAAYERRFARRGVGLDETLGGSGSLNGTLTPEVREAVRLALEAAGVPAARRMTAPRDSAGTTRSGRSPGSISLTVRTSGRSRANGRGWS